MRPHFVDLPSVRLLLTQGPNQGRGRYSGPASVSPWIMPRGSGSVDGFIVRIGSVHDGSGSMVGVQGSFSSWIAGRSARANRASRVSPGAQGPRLQARLPRGRAASRVDQACPDLGGGHSSTESLICAPRTVA